MLGDGIHMSHLGLLVLLQSGSHSCLVLLVKILSILEGRSRRESLSLGGFESRSDALKNALGLLLLCKGSCRGHLLLVRGSLGDLRGGILLLDFISGLLRCRCRSLEVCHALLVCCNTLQVGTALHGLVGERKRAELHHFVKLANGLARLDRARHGRFNF